MVTLVEITSLLSRYSHWETHWQLQWRTVLNLECLRLLALWHKDNMTWLFRKAVSIAMNYFLSFYFKREYYSVFQEKRFLTDNWVNMKAPKHGVPGCLNSALASFSICWFHCSPATSSPALPKSHILNSIPLDHSVCVLPTQGPAFPHLSWSHPISKSESLICNIHM